MTDADDAPSDVRTIVSTEYALASLRSGVLMSDIDLNDGVSRHGVQVVRDGATAGIVCGTLYDAEDDIRVYQSLTAEQMRDLATALNEQAGIVEEIGAQDVGEGDSDRTDGPESFLRRLLP